MSFLDSKRIVSPFAKEKALVAVSVLIGVFAALLNISRPILFGSIVSELVERPTEAHWQWYILLYFFSWFLTWVISLLLDFFAVKVSQNILMHLRHQCFSHFLNLPVRESEKMNPGRIEMYTTSDLPNWSNLYGVVLAQVVHASAQFVGAAIALSSLDSRLTLYLIPFLVLSILIPIMCSRKMIGLSRAVQAGLGSVLENVSSLVQGIRDILSFRAERWAMNRFKRSCETVYHATIKRDLAQSFMEITSGATEIIAYVIVLIIGCGQVVRNELSVGELVAFLATIELIFFPARYANSLFGQIQNSIASAKRVWEFLDSKEEKASIPNARGIEMREVGFTHSGSHKKTLQNINLEILPGMLVAIIGESGSGKSTLLQIISGLYKPTEGSITYIRGTSQAISCVWQDPFLFKGSIVDNLTLGTEIHINELKRMVANVNADQIVMKMPNGYESEVLNRGENFSGGEKRRLALVRALARQPHFVILDEPTAGLDVENARAVWQAIVGLGSSVTRVVSTHRMEEARQADWIVVLKEGKVIETGTPEELLAVKGSFSRGIEQSTFLAREDSL